MSCRFSRHVRLRTAFALCATALVIPSAAAFTTPLSLFSSSPARLRSGVGRPPMSTTGGMLRMAAPADLEGVYDFAHPGGVFDVHLRPGGRFFAPQFQARASWNLEGQRLLVDFAKFGRYEFTRVGELEGSADFEGSAVGDPSNWRKMKRRRKFSVAEAKLLDSIWELQHPGGSFPVEFRADGFNHFVSKDFPAHSHWSLTGDTVYINWGAYGEYELILDDAGESMAGSVKGQPENWRKAVRKGALEEQVAAKEVFTDFH